MKSRMDKYNTNNNYAQRVSKNEQLYKDINKQELDKFKLNSNASVLENDGQNIDIEELKSILDRKYRNPSQRKSIFIPKEEEVLEKEQIETKEYDINAILAKARETQEANYEEERFKKISATQYNILKSLSVEKQKPEEKVVTPEEENLMTLINTITAKELEQTSQVDPLDILSDLKGSDNTEVIPPIKEEKILETPKENNKSIDKSFYTNSIKFTDEDFEDVDEGKGINKVLIWILIGIAVVTFIGGIVFLLNKLLDLGLF